MNAIQSYDNIISYDSYKGMQYIISYDSYKGMQYLPLITTLAISLNQAQIGYIPFLTSTNGPNLRLDTARGYMTYNLDVCWKSYQLSLHNNDVTLCNLVICSLMSMAINKAKKTPYSAYSWKNGTPVWFTHM